MANQLQPCDVSDPIQHQAIRRAGDAEDAAYDALQAFADALYEEALLVRLQTPEQADVIIRGILARIGEEMAHDWVYELE